MNQRRPDMSQSVDRELAEIRDLFSKGQYAEGGERATQFLDEVYGLLKSGSDDQQWLLRYYYAAAIMAKVGKYHQVMLKPPKRQTSVQTVLIDESREHVLLQRRGPYKRLFPAKYTVSANTRVDANASAAESAAAVADAVTSEVGLRIEPERVEFPTDGRTNPCTLTSFDLQALSPEEEDELRGWYKQNQHAYGCTDVILIDYAVEKACLCVFTLSQDKTHKDAVRELAEEVADATGIPYMYAVDRKDRHFPAVYCLTTKEKSAVLREIRRRNAGKARISRKQQRSFTKRTLKRLDSDSMEFAYWSEVRDGARMRPRSYAQDVTEPYFSSDSTWLALGVARPMPIISVQDANAAHVSVAGGKGVNTRILRRLARRESIFAVPATSVVTSFVYERFVLGDRCLRGLIDNLDTLPTRKSRAKAARQIRRRIGELSLPTEFRKEVARQLRRLGGDLAVRSSSTVEDLVGLSGAGLADSLLHQTSEDAAVSAVKHVWGSLFSDAFVEYRKDNRIRNVDARMPVLLQALVGDAKAAGIVRSIDGAASRPVYSIDAQPGLGDSVAQGEGLVDTWRVNLLADAVLEKSIGSSKVHVVPAAGGGLRKEAQQDAPPCLSDREALGVAKAVKAIHRYYREHDLAKEIDVEYVVDLDSKIYVVQARWEKEAVSVRQDGKQVTMVTVANKKRVPCGTHVVQLDTGSSLVACPGAVSGELQVVTTYNPRAALEGRIIVTLQTNNAWDHVFSVLKGAITTGGGESSHAAKNAREYGIPCVVAASDAIEKLQAYSGKIVTFDASDRCVYVGRVPVVPKERPCDIWVSDPDELAARRKGRPKHEIFRDWHENWETSRGVYKEYFDGRWRRRSHHWYGLFQLDYYYKAWDRLTDLLNAWAGPRRPWRLLPPERMIGKDRCLFHPAELDKRSNIYAFLACTKNIDVPDLAELLDRRFEAFGKFSRFVDELDTIHRGNVALVVDNLVEVFGWMHFAWWLNAAVTNLFLYDQLESIEPAYHEALKAAATADLPRERTDRLARRRDKEYYALVEEIRSDPELRAMFEKENVAEIERYLRSRFRDVISRIDGWSKKYKMGETEDIAIPSDTSTYLTRIRGALMEDVSLSLPAIAGHCQRLLRDRQVTRRNLRAISQKDEELRKLLRSYARQLAAGSKEGGASPKRHLDAVEARMDAAMKGIVAELKAREGKRKTMADLIDNYPRLKKIVALSEMETALRDNGHHLIVGPQRRIAHLMVEAAQRSKVLDEPMQVFDIATEELIAMLSDSSPKYIRITLKRSRLMEHAEKELETSWESSYVRACDTFEVSVKEAIRLAAQQAQEAQQPRTRWHYERVIHGLTERLQRVRQLARG